MTSLEEAFPSYKKLIGAEQLKHDYNESIDDLELIHEKNPRLNGKRRYKSKKTNYVYLYNLFDKIYLRIS